MESPAILAVCDVFLSTKRGTRGLQIRGIPRMLAVLLVRSMGLVRVGLKLGKTRRVYPWRGRSQAREDPAGLPVEGSLEAPGRPRASILEVFGALAGTVGGVSRGGSRPFGQAGGAVVRTSSR